MQEHLNAVKRMLAFVLVGASLIAALSVGGAMQDTTRPTQHVAAIAAARG